MLSKLFLVVLKPILPYLIGIVILFAVFTYGSWTGAAKRDQYYTLLMEVERERIAEINIRTREAARIREMVLETQLEQLENQIARITNEATQDPNASRPAFGTDSLRRLDQLR